MACPIEVGKTIDNSISKLLPNLKAVMSKAAAENIAKKLNDLWGNIASAKQYSGNGGHVVVIDNIEKAVVAEYDRQVKMEAQFSRDHAFFNNDAGLYEQEQREFELEDIMSSDLAELKLTSNVINYLWERSSKRLEKGIFAKQAYIFIEKNRNLMSTEEIIEKLTCL